METRGGPGRARGDEGFSVIEVMLALVLLITTMAAMGPFFINSFQFVARQRADQAAIQLANGAIEQVRALKGSSLLSGRSQTKSTDQWRDAFQNGPEAVKAYLAVPGLETPSAFDKKLTMRLAWDTTPATALSAGEDAAISTLPQQMTSDSTVYTRSIFVGECNVYLMNLPGYVRGSGDCVNPDVVPPPGDSDPRVLQFFRAVALVTWPDKKCAENRCSRIASTLISRASEPTFDFNRPAPELHEQKAIFSVGQAGEYALQATGGQLPNTWAMGGTSKLPAGLTLNGTTGRITGTPTAAGTYSGLWVTVTDDLKRSDSQPVLTIVVIAPPAVTMPANQRNAVGGAVSQKVTVTGGTGPYVVKVTGLPPGLTTNLPAGGTTAGGSITISGAGTTAGSYTVTVDVTDSTGLTAKGTYTHVIVGPPQLTPLPDRTITLGSAFSATATATGGDGSYTYSASGLPLGVLIDAKTGVLSGLPTIPGGYLCTVTVKDGLGGTSSVTFALAVNTSTALNLTSPGNQTTAVGDDVKLDIESNDGLLGLKPKYSATGLPDGLKLSPTGTVSGKPKTAGTYLVTVTGTNLLPPQSSTATFLWTIT